MKHYSCVCQTVLLLKNKMIMLLMMMMMMMMMVVVVVVQMCRLLLVSVLLVICVTSISALMCNWCVGVHCQHAGSGEEIECDGSCYSMVAQLSDGTPLSVVLFIVHDNRTGTRGHILVTLH